MRVGMAETKPYCTGHNMETLRKGNKRTASISYPTESTSRGEEKRGDLKVSTVCRIMLIHGGAPTYEGCGTGQKTALLTRFLSY